MIIDGQQRLTTIYLLIKALIDSTDDEREKGILTETLFNVDKFNRFGIDDSSKMKFKPIKSDNQQLFFLMENKFDEIDKNSGIYRNYLLFKKLITKAISKICSLLFPEMAVHCCSMLYNI